MNEVYIGPRQSPRVRKEQQKREAKDSQTHSPYVSSDHASDCESVPCTLAAGADLEDSASIASDKASSKHLRLAVFGSYECSAISLQGAIKWGKLLTVSRA